VSVLVTVLRRLRGWSQQQMVEHSGVNKSSLSSYEMGKVLPSRATLERLAAAAGVPMWAVDGALSPVIELARRAQLGAVPPPAEGAAVMDAAHGQKRSAAERMALALFLGGDDAAGGGATAAGEREEPRDSEESWTPLPVGIPLVGGELGAAFERLIECACAESERVAANEPRQALALARLARQVAELAPGGETWRSGLQSKAWAFEGNALRVAAELRGADAAFAAARELRQLAGARAEDTFPGWRLAYLEASLRREQRRLGRALELLDQALVASPEEARGCILLKKAFTLEQAGRSEAALAVLAEAAPLIERAGERRERMGVRFNTAVNLWHLGRFKEAERCLAELRPLVLDLGGDLDLLRWRWLGARVAAGLGRREEALAELAAVRGEFERRRNAYDAALVALDTAILLLEAGSTREVATLAQEMLWVFEAQQLHREALAALRLFVEAAEREAATEELARRVREYFEAARYDPRPFEPRERSGTGRERRQLPR
jgi:transcriptional regulator with XRE-family HTH domain/tetratricopeptide (TPR) repeat protein